MDLVLAPENTVFAVSLVLMAGIAVLEGVMTLIGFGLSSLLDDLVPDSLLPGEPDLGVDAAEGLEVGSPSALSALLGWLCVGKTPVLVLIVAFLTSFGLAGMILQSFSHGLFGFFLPGWIAAAPAVAVALPGTRIVGLAVSRIMPNDETTAVSLDSFVGRVAVITLGTAEVGKAAQARLKDEHGQAHYVMVEPSDPAVTFGAGDDVLIVERRGAVYTAIRNTNPALRDSL